MQYSIGNDINEGRYGRVYQVRKDGKTYAAKVLPKHRIDLPDFRNHAMIKREIANHKKVNGHPNVVKLVDVVEDWGNFYIVQEFCDKGDLSQELYKRQLPPDTSKNVLRDCLKALDTCHQEGFIFGDLKPENILLGENNFKLCDFGSSDNARDMYTGSTTLRGTPAFLAPESIVYKKDHGFIIDMWSVGILAYMLLYDKLPYDVNCDQKGLVAQMLEHEIEYTGKLPEYGEDFIRKCLEKDVMRRMTCKEALKHPFLIT